MSRNSQVKADRLRADGRRAFEKVKDIAWKGFSAAVDSYYVIQGTPALPDDSQCPTLKLPPPGVTCPLCSRCLSLLSYFVTRFGDGTGFKPLRVTHGRFGTGCTICAKASEMWDLAMAHGRFHRDYQGVGRGRWIWQWHLDRTDPRQYPLNTAIREPEASLGIKFEACYLEHSFTIGSVGIYPSEPVVGARQPSHPAASHDLTVPLINPPVVPDDYLGKNGLHVEMMLTWLTECMRTHPRCRYVSEWRPDRLVAWDAARSLFRIVRREHEPDEPFFRRHKIYLSLSHCWGTDTGERLNLTTSNLEEWCRELPFDRLPATLRDALALMTHLGAGLMWIDSLCILQDSKEDWLVQSASMADVYKNALCNVAIVSARSDDEGFAKRRNCADEFGFTVSLAAVLGRSPGESHVVPTWEGESRQVSVLLKGESKFVWHQAEYHNNRMDRHPLYTRGWVFQEREMPRRTLGITERGPFFSCDTGRRDEHNSNTRSLSSIRGVREQQFGSTWTEYIKQYTSRQLTRPSDRLIAFSAIARELAPLGGRYLAGLWERGLLQRLTWKVMPDSATAAVPYIAPSWSWASVVAPIDGSMGDSGIPLATVVDVEVYPETDFIYGSVKGGYIHMRGRLYILKDIRPEHQTDHPIRGYPLLRVSVEPMSLQYRSDTLGSVYADQIRCMPICASTASRHGYLLTTYLIIQEVQDAAADAGRVYRRVGIGQAEISYGILGMTKSTNEGVAPGNFVRSESFDVDLVLV